MIEFVAETETPGISPICGYKTSDGLFFQDKEQAAKHQAVIEAKKKARKNQIEIVLDIVNEHRKWRLNRYNEVDVQKYLNRKDGWNYSYDDDPELRRALSTWSQLTSLKPLYEKYKHLI
jgi:hypothetical protein